MEVETRVDTTWRTLDQLVRVDCASRIQGSRIDGVIERAVERRRLVIRAPRTIEDFNSLNDSEVLGPDFCQQKIAWISQRITNARVWAVGVKPLHVRNGGVYSPVLDQLRMFDVSVDTSKNQAVLDRWEGRQTLASDKLDALAIDSQARTVYLIQGASTGQIRGGRTRELASLFIPESQILCDAWVAGHSVNTLLRTRELIQHSAPRWSVKMLFFVIDEGYSWVFQCHDLSSLHDRVRHDELVLLDAHPVFATTKNFTEQLRGNPDLFLSVGNPPPFRNLREAIAVSPVYRFTRSMMTLIELWDRQRLEKDRLATITAPELQTIMRDRYSIVYTDDACRHDLWDCLRAGGFVRRLPYRKSHYALDQLGVARVLTMLHKYNSMTPTDTRIMLDCAFGQAMLWLDQTDRGLV